MQFYYFVEFISSIKKHKIKNFSNPYNGCKSREIIIFAAQPSLGGFVKNVKILTIESDFGAGKKGAKLGPQALLKTIEKKFPGLLNEVEAKSVQTHELESDDSQEDAKNIDNILSIQEDAIQQLEEILSTGSLPFVISGDHSNGLAGISALKNLNPKWNIGVIWIDAHSDLHTPFTSPSGNMHGMPLAAALGIGKDKNNKKSFDGAVIEKWQQLIELGSKKIKPKLLPQNLVFIDIRDLETEETSIIQNQNIKHFTPEIRKEIGVKEIIKQTLEHLSSCDCILLSFDVDSLDPSISYGTGTPVPEGLSLNEAVEMLQAFLSEPKTKLFEMTEINPLLDRHHPMEEVAAEIVGKVLQSFDEKK